ncbi:PP2C family protein-serine/threonine phosphatase [Streptomyces sp. NPDC101206]|uniref:PP2C family protein-serine/threonine phosphatase n=1 Tax=Streptomyces sp. NPDC101206 TaxID=3366128 RepID=UPI003814A2B2
MRGLRRRRRQEPGWLRGAPPPRWARLAPVVALVVLVLAQRLTPGDIELGFFLAGLPPVAAFAYGAAGTAVFAGLVLTLLGLPWAGIANPRGTDMATVAAVGLLSVVIAWVRRRRDTQLVNVRTVAEAAQLAVLPPVPERVGPVRCAGLYRAAQHGTLVGGDLYDVRAGPYGVRALVGDVQGHGLAAVGTVAALLGAFREGVLDDPELTEVAARLDRRLQADAAAPEAGSGMGSGPGTGTGTERGKGKGKGKGSGSGPRSGSSGALGLLGPGAAGSAGAPLDRAGLPGSVNSAEAPGSPGSQAPPGSQRTPGTSPGTQGSPAASGSSDASGEPALGGSAEAAFELGHPELFATALLLEFPPGLDLVRIVSCGHPPALLLRGPGVSEVAVEPGPPLGLGLTAPEDTAVTGVALLPGDRLLAYTDGVTEARDGSGFFYPLATRVPVVATPAPADPAGLVGALWQDLVAFTGGGPGDDVALLVLSLERRSQPDGRHP